MNKEKKQYLIDSIYAFLAVVEKEFLKEEPDEFVDILKEIYDSEIPFKLNILPDTTIEIFLLDNRWNILWNDSFFDYDEAIREFIKAILKFYPDSEFAIKLNNHAYFNYLLGEEEG